MMKSLVAYTELSKPSGIILLEKPKICEGHLIIKVHSSPISQGDANLYERTFFKYLELKQDYIFLGSEGIGQIVEKGDKTPAEFKIGSYVVFSKSIPSMSKEEYYGGGWSEYIRVHYRQCLVIDPKNKPENYCSILNTFLTILGMIDKIQAENHKAFIFTGASSSFGRALIKWCCSKKITGIFVCRGEANVSMLKQLGAEYVLDQTSSSFVKDLSILAEKLKATIVFDSVAGDLVSLLIEAIPYQSSIYLFGNLSGKEELTGIKTWQVILKKITMKPFALSDCEFLYNVHQLDLYFEEMKKFIKTTNYDPGAIVPFELDKHETAFAEFKKAGSKGKFIFLMK